MASRTSEWRPALLAAAVGLLMGGVAQAQIISYAGLTASGNHQLLNGAASDILSHAISSGPGSVKVFSFPFARGSTAGLYAYGGSVGIFGARFSGAGVYDVASQFAISLNVRNDQATAQQVVFNFHITPSLLRVDDLPLQGVEFLEAGVSFAVMASNGAAFNSAASLLSNAGGLSLAGTGTNIYSGFNHSRTVIGGNFSLNLGVMQAGQSIDLNYTLQSLARGNAAFNGPRLVPAQKIVIPAHWITCTNEQLAQLALGKISTAATTDVDACSQQPVFVPERIVLTQATTVEGDYFAGSQASSGDPLSFEQFAFSETLLPPPALNGRSISVSMTPQTTNPPNNQVPEPGALSLALVALASAALAGQRRR